MTRLPDADTSFFYAALHQLDPAVRPIFTARVAAIIDTLPDPGPGDVDRAIRAALAGLWTPPPDNARAARRTLGAPGRLRDQA